MRYTLLVAGILAGMTFVLPAASLAESADGARGSSSSSGRNQVSTSNELADRKKRDEEVANAPPPKPRDKSQDASAPPSMPVIPVNPTPLPAVPPAR